MIVTPFKIFYLPAFADKIVKGRRREVYSNSYVAIDEFVSRLRGEPATSIYTNPFHPQFEDKMNSAINPEYVKIKSSEGESWGACKQHLIRRFTFFDDFFSAFPNEKEVSVPFGRYVCIDALTGSGKLADCYECLSFFNPKDTRYYLTFDTNGCSIDILIHIAYMLTQEERIEMIEAYRASSGTLPIPYEGMGIGIIANILLLHKDYDNMKLLFSNCPSYLLLATRDENILLHGDFSREHTSLSSDQVYWIAKTIVDIIMKTDSKDVAKRMMTMMCIRHPLFGNENDYIVPPYRVYGITLRGNKGDWRQEIAPNVSSLFSLPIEVVKQAFNSL